MSEIIRETEHLYVNDFHDRMHGIKFILIFSKDAKRIEEFLDTHDDEGRVFLVRGFAGAVHKITYDKLRCAAICLTFDELDGPEKYGIISHEVAHASIVHFKKLGSGLPVVSNIDNDEELLCHHIQYLTEWVVKTFQEKDKYIWFLPNDHHHDPRPEN